MFLYTYISLVPLPKFSLNKGYPLFNSKDIKSETKIMIITRKTYLVCHLPFESVACLEVIGPA